MSLCAPDMRIEATVTQFEDHTIGFQITAPGGPADDDTVVKMLMAVVRQIQRNRAVTMPPPVTQPLFQETVA